MDDDTRYHSAGGGVPSTSGHRSTHRGERGEVCECVDEWVWVRSVSLASHSLSLPLSGRIDAMLEETLSLKGIPASQIPGRPKRWKSKCMEMLDTSISNKSVHQTLHNDRYCHTPP